MRTMPFCRTGIGHRLHNLIFRRQRGSQTLGFAAHPEIVFEKLIPIAWLRVQNGRLGTGGCHGASPVGARIPFDHIFGTHPR
jgi:hypothetical protein